MCCMVLCFKQKSAYEMRISDWSLDVCSSELGVPIVGAPLAFGADGVGNSEVHNVGEVWAEMLWEVYASLLNHHDFQTAQDRMKDYVIGGLKMTDRKSVV